MDLCFELAQLICDRLRAAAHVVDEVHGFRSFDDRDLLGFVDGTENPEGGAAGEAVLIGGEDAAFAHGSYAVVQKYLHDLGTWNALSVEDQERAVGRTKLNDVELPDDAKPANSHVALNTIVDDDGTERQIMRFNMPFGRVGAQEFGTYFIGYARYAGRDRADAREHVRRQAAGDHRPAAGLLHRGHRRPVLRAVGRLPRRPAGARGRRGRERRVALDRQLALGPPPGRRATTGRGDASVLYGVVAERVNTTVLP